MEENKAENVTRTRRSRCRLCRQLCDPNKRLWDRDFREKLQDITCLWIKISHGTEKYHVCSSCQDQVELFYSFKRRSRQILHNESIAAVPSNTCNDFLLDSLVENYTDEINQPLKTDIDGYNDHSNEDDSIQPEVKPADTEHAIYPPEQLTPTPSDDHPGQNGSGDAETLEKPQTKKERPFRRKYKRTEEEKTMTLAEYKKHYMRQYLDKSKKMCDICGKSLIPKRMESHMNRHNGLQPYSCDECGLKFHCRMNLRKHVNRSHAKDSEVTCDLCGKVSTSIIAHKQHMRAVHVEKKFQCTLCEVKTRTKRAMDAHMDIHNQRRDFVCPQCGKAFYRKYVLSIHLRTHSGETPYKCHVCPDAFVHRRMYVMHMKKHHPDEPIMRIDGVKALKDALMKKDYL